jgi:hypothetical protein
MDGFGFEAATYQLIKYLMTLLITQLSNITGGILPPMKCARNNFESRKMFWFHVYSPAHCFSDKILVS